MNEDCLHVVNKLPIEMLINIFELLTPEALTACRAVCKRWKTILDDPDIIKILWSKNCEKYYSVYPPYVKLMPGLRCDQLYQSLSLWADVSLSQETISEIYAPRRKYFKDVTVLRDGIIAVLVGKNIFYYNVDTLKLTKKIKVPGNTECNKYSENDDSILIKNHLDQLLVIRKENRNVVVNIFEDVKTFMFLKGVIYYVTFTDTIFKCVFVNGTYTRSSIAQSPEDILALGHKNGIAYVFTYNDNIYSCVNNALTKIPTSNSDIDELETLRSYNFASHALCFLNNGDFYVDHICIHDEEFLFQKKVGIMCIHGPVMIASFYTYIIRIYYSVYTSSITDLLETQPLKEYTLFNSESEVIGPIYSIEVIESVQGHIVIVVLREKIVIIKITHPFKSEKSSQSLEVSSTSTSSI